MSGIFPFTLAGPSFLFFYAALSALVLIGFWYYNTSSQPGQEARLSELTSDPYRIAYLRAGAAEMVRVAIVNLVDRGLLEAKDDAMLVCAKAQGADLVRRPLDRAILARCATPMPIVHLADSPEVLAAGDAYDAELKGKGLLLDDAARQSRFTGLLVVLAVLGGIALLRLYQALSHGRSNVGFLVILAIAAGGIAIYLYAGRATAAGTRALSSLQTLTKRLQARADQLRKGGATNEALLLAAVFGIYALTNPAFAFVEKLFPKPKESRSSNCGSSCGSGGGGCGGGGGGCGGCGGS